MRGPFVRTKGGTIEASFRAGEVAVLRDVAMQMTDASQVRDETTVRLYPPAYDEAGRQAAYEELMGDDLAAAKRAACTRMIASIDAGEERRGRWRATLDDEEAHAWLGVMNDARLVLGTRLDVGEDMDHSFRPPTDPDAHAFNLYLYLGALQEALIDALSPGLGPGAEDPR